METLTRFQRGELKGPELEWVEAWTAESRLGSEVTEFIQPAQLKNLTDITERVNQRVAAKVNQPGGGWTSWKLPALVVLIPILGLITWSLWPTNQMEVPQDTSNQQNAVVLTDSLSSGASLNEEPLPSDVEEPPSATVSNTKIATPASNKEELAQGSVNEVVPEASDSDLSSAEATSNGDQEITPNTAESPPMSAPPVVRKSPMLQVVAVEILNIHPFDPSTRKEKKDRDKKRQGIDGPPLGEKKKSSKSNGGNIAVPEFYGGDSGLKDYLRNNLGDIQRSKIPVDRKNIVIRFSVTSKGELHDVEIMTPVLPAIDEKVMELIRNMPKWKPGRNGKRGAVSYMVSISLN
ncbi:MAG: hypothetical protein ACFB10_12960 [Salibacteraceae bacterium]